MARTFGLAASGAAWAAKANVQRNSVRMRRFMVLLSPDTRIGGGNIALGGAACICRWLGEPSLRSPYPLPRSGRGEKRRASGPDRRENPARELRRRRCDHAPMKAAVF